MSNLLDDIFQWAAQQQPDSRPKVSFAMTMNETSRNLVSYAEGVLYYSPAKSAGPTLFLPTLSSEKNGVTQYFSDRRHSPDGGGFTTCPFSCSDADPLDVIVRQVAPFGGDYSVELKSTKWGWEISFAPSFDAATSVLYGVIDKTFITISLCNRSASPPPR